MTAAERTKCQQLVRGIIGSHELEGVTVSETIKRLLDVFARGDVSTDGLATQVDMDSNLVNEGFTHSDRWHDSN